MHLLGKLIAKDRINKQAAQKFIVDMFQIKKLSEVQVREHYQIKISYSNDIEDINRARENIKENIKTSAQDSLGPYERTQHKQWFDEECS